MIKLILPKFWYRKGIISYLLWPLSLGYQAVLYLYRYYCQFVRYLFPQRFGVPVVVIGNITVGGAGKTPLVIGLANILQQNGYNPGIVSRGYGGTRVIDCVEVVTTSRVEEVGEEALLLVKNTDCPMFIGHDRVMAIQTLLKNHKCNVVLSDDGLQHYRLHRDVEIVVVDDEFGFGNCFCLPAGPLREPIARLQQVDFVVRNYNTGVWLDVNSKEYQTRFEPLGFCNLQNPNWMEEIDALKGQVVHAVAGIGRPERFFQTLRALGLDIIEHPFPDHYIFKESDLAFGEGIVIMTEKDAIKCVKIAKQNFWYLKIVVKLDEALIKDFLGVLQGTYSGK